MTKRVLTVLLSAAMLLGLLAGCGGSNATSNAAETAAAPTEESKEEARAQDIGSTLDLSTPQEDSSEEEDSAEANDPSLQLYSYDSNYGVGAKTTGLPLTTDGGKKGKLILVTAITPTSAGEGKTTIAINLADALAEAGSRVLLIDCDLRSPSVARALNRENEVGLAEYLKGETTYQHIIQRSDNQNLFLIFAGRPVSDASELFAKPECRQFLEACRGTFDYIILDTPPAALLADAAEVAELADGAILAIRQNYAPRHKILECAQLLSDSKLPIIGCVMNYVAGGSSGSGYYGYGYGYGGYGYGYGYGSYGKGKDTTQINL